MKVSNSVRAVAIACISIGLFVLYLIIGMMFTMATMDSVADDGLFRWIAAFSITPLAIPPLMATLYGIQLFRSPSKSAVKGAIGGTTIIVSIVLVLSVQEKIIGKVEGNYSFLAVAVIALPIYVYASKYVITALLGEPLARGELVGRGIKGLISIQTAFAYSSVIMDRMSDGPLWLPLTPILVGAICYYILLGLPRAPKPPVKPA